MMYKKMIFISMIIGILVVAGCAKSSIPVDTGTDFGKIQKGCENLNGIWLEESKECESISQADCTSLGGTFNECASACRNNPKAEVCTMQCVIVCDFSK